MPRALLALLAGLVLATSVPTVAGAQEGDVEPGRLLVFTVPGLTWDEVEDLELPALEGFFATSAMADMAPRGVRARSGAGDAYLTISAGARADTVRSVDGQVLGVDEQSSGSAAGEIFRRRTGLVPDGDHVSLAWPELRRSNARRPYDAVLGLLAETLDDHDISVTAIGNADGTDSVGPSYHRQVGLAVADTDGVVADASIGKDLLVSDAAAPFGERLDPAVVVERFEEAWAAAAPDESSPGGMVILEASDVARVLRYRSLVDSGRYQEMLAEALHASDELFDQLMEVVDPARDSVMVLAPYNRVRDRDLTAVALRRPDTEPGYLASASTQRAGFLTLVDVAPTILATFDIERPVEMEGRPAEVHPRDVSLEERVDHLISLNAASRFRERLLTPTTAFVVVLLTLVTAAAAVSLITGRGKRWRATLAALALLDLAVLPASYLARAFPLEDLGAGFYWGFTLAAGAAVAVLATAVGRATSRPRTALAVVLALVALVLTVDVMTGSNLSLSSAFGYSATGNSRLYGISNYSYGQLAAATCILAAFLAATRPPGRGRILAIALLVFTLVVLGVPVWGSDVGGVLAFTPTILVFAALVLRRRIRLRTVVAGGIATVVAVTTFGLLDLARPPGERAHLGRLFERVGDEGLEPLFSIIERKLLANLRVSTSSMWVLAIPIAVAFFVLLVRYPGRPIDAVVRRVPTIGAGLAAVLVAAVLGSLANDSGVIVGGVAALVVTASLVHLTMAPGPEVVDGGRPRSSPSVE
jgi:hypothetical protein